MSEIYDIIIIWAWASGLFCACNLWDDKSVLILEWSSDSAQKLLLSAKWRWNLTNKKINPKTDYACDNIEFVNSSFSQYNADNFLQFLDNWWIEYKEEDFWRILLKNNKVWFFKQYLLDLIERKNIEIKYWEKVWKITKSNNWNFEIKTNNGTFYSKNVIIATWWPSFPILWASDFSNQFAKEYKLEYTEFLPALVWFETEQDFSSLSWSSIQWNLTLKDWNKILYKQEWPILFTHRWISGPCVFNASLFLRWKEIENSDLKVSIQISSKEITKRLLGFLWFRTNKLNNYTISTKITKTRELNEAKVCTWWVKTSNLKENFECKNIPWLYMIWECLDVTGKTWGFNLQWCWTSAYICAKNFNNQ